jgi:hypothetical protein
MKVRPILMSASMIRALVENRKSQTRRVIKPQPTIDGGSDAPGCPEWWLEWKDHEIGYTPDELARLCPYGQPGDLLWVRETLHNDSDMSWMYAADTQYVSAEYPAEWASKQAHKPSIPSIHMPRWASRLTLEITEVRVERLNDISRTDAAAEGVCLDLGKPLPDWCRSDRWPEENFRALWESIHGPGGWEANPWCWAISFAVQQQNIDALLSSRSAQPVLRERIAVLIREINAQDNRATASPYYYVVQSKKWVDTVHEGDKQVIYDDGLFTLEEWTALGPEYTEESWEKRHPFCVREEWEDCEIFLTEKAALLYIRANRHRLNEPRTYVKHFWRNSQMELVMKALEEFSGESLVRR